MAGAPQGWPSSVSPDLRRIAEQALTPKQLEVIQLVAWGLGDRRMSLLLGVSREAIRDRREKATLRMFRALGGEVALW